MPTPTIVACLLSSDLGGAWDKIMHGSWPSESSCRIAAFAAICIGLAPTKVAACICTRCQASVMPSLNAMPSSLHTLT
jgi:hypothetical protein